MFRVLQCFESNDTCKSRDEVVLRLSQYGSIKTIVRDAIAEFSLEILSRLETELEMAFAISTSRYLNNVFDDGLLRTVRLKQGPKGSWDETLKSLPQKIKMGAQKEKAVLFVVHLVWFIENTSDQHTGL